MKEDIKIHELQYQVLVNSLNIQIRFPCKITASFRVGKNQTHSNESVGLENGGAKFTEPIITKGMMHMIDGCYQEKKSYLTIYVLSNSGKNIAGVCPLDLSLHTSEDWKTIDKQLQRCPDRNARICLQIRSSLVRQLEQSPSQSAKSQTPRPAPILTPRENPNTTLPLSRKTKPPTTYRQTRTANTSLRLNNIVLRERSVHSYRGESQQKRSDSRTDDFEKNRQISDLKDEVTDRERRITRLEVEKQAYLREVQGLKGQLDTIKAQVGLRANKELQLVGENEKLKRKLQSTENALEIMKIKRAELQKRENQRRNSSINDKNLIEDLRIKAQAVEELQKQLQFSKKSKQQLDRLVREKSRQLREISQRCDDQATTINTLQKRLQMKQNFYKQEIKKYNERQLELQSEKQRLNAEIGVMRETIDQKQKGLIQNSKENQRLWLQQKAKLTKRIELLKHQLETVKLNSQNTTKQTNIQSQQIDRLHSQLHQSFQQNQRLKLQLQRVKKQLTNQMSFRLKYEQQQKQKSTLKLQKASLQKQLEEYLSTRDADFQDVNKQITQKSEQIKALNDKINENNKKSREKDQKIQQLQNNYDLLSKRFEVIKKSEEKKSLQLTQLKNLEKTLVLDIQSLDQQRQQLELTIQNMKFKQETQTDQLKKSIRKSHEQCEVLRNRLRNQTENSARLIDANKIANQKCGNNLLTIGKLEEKIKKIQKQCYDSNSREKDLTQEVQRLTSALYESKQSLKKSYLKNQENQKKISKLENQKIKLGLTLQQLARVQKQLKQKQAQLILKNQSETQLKMSLQKQQLSLNTLKQDLKSKINDINRERLQFQSLKRELAILNEKLQTSQRIVQQKNVQISQIKVELQKIANDRKIFEQKVSSLNSQNKKYRQTVLQSLRISFTYIFGNRQGPEPQLYDYQLTQIQRELIRKLSKVYEQHASQLKICRQHLEESYRQKIELANHKHEQLYSQLKSQYETKKEELHYFREGMAVKNQELVKQMESMHEQLLAVEEDIQFITQEKEQFQSLYRRLLLQNQEIKATNQQLQRQILNSSKDVKQLEQQIARQRCQKEQIFAKVYLEREKTQNQMQTAQKAMILQIQQLQNTVKSRELQIQSLNSQSKKLIKQLQAKSQIIKNKDREAQQSTALVNQLEGQITNFHKRQKQLLEKVRLNEQSLILQQQKLFQVKSTLGLISTKQREFEQIKGTYEREKQTLNKKINFMDQQVKLYEQSNSKLKKQSQELHEKLYSAQKEIVKLSDLSKSYEETLTKKASQLEEKISELHLMKEKALKLQKQLQHKEDLKNQLTSKYQNQIYLLNLENQEAKIKLSQSQSDLKKTGDIKTNARQLQRQLVKIRAQKEELSKKLANSNQELKDNLQSLEKLKTQEQSTMAQIQSMRIFSQQTQNQNIQLQNDLEVRNREYSQLSKRFQILDKQYKSLQQSYKQTNMKFSQIEDQLDNIKTQRDLMIDNQSQKVKIANQLKSALQKNSENQQQTQKLRQYCHSLEQTLEKYKQDKGFVYQQLRAQIQKNNILAKEKQELSIVNEDKINGIMEIYSGSVQQFKKLFSTITEQTDVINQLKASITALQSEKQQFLKQIAQQDRSHKADNYKYQIEIRQLVKAKTGLINNLQQMSRQIACEKEELEQIYDKEFRQMEAKRIQQSVEADERVKRVYKEKYEDQVVLRFEIERLKNQLEKKSGSLQNSMKSSISLSVINDNKSEFKQEMTDAKMKHYLAKEPLRNLQALVPHILWLCQQNQKINHNLTIRIRQLEQDQKNSIYYISPAKILQQQSLKPQSQLIEKVRQADANLRITFNRVEQIGKELEQLTQQKLRILGKSRQLQDLLAVGSETMVLQDKICEILDYSRIQAHITAFDSEKNIPKTIQRCDSKVIVMDAKEWIEQSNSSRNLP